MRNGPPGIPLVISKVKVGGVRSVSGIVTAQSVKKRVQRIAKKGIRNLIVGVLEFMLRMV